MGNVGSTSGNGSRRRHRSRRSRQAPLPQPDMVNRYVYPAATAPYPTPGYYQYPAGYYPPPGTVGPPLPAPYDDHHHRVPNGNWAARHGHHPCGPAMGPPAPCVEYQMAATIRNDVNLKKETIKFVGDEEMPGKYLLEFTFDAATDGSIAILYFAKEGEDGNLAPTKESLLPAVKVNFQQGLGQKFRQPSGTGIDFSAFEGTELLKETDTGVFPLAVKAESPAPPQTGADGNLIPGSTNSQITQAVFEKEKDEYRVKVVKQILWVNGSRYELQEIYGIGQTVEGDFDGSDPGKECVICLSEPRDTAVLPCRHMCMCNGCAKVLRYRTNRCPICRQPVDRLLEINFANFPQVNAD